MLLQPVILESQHAMSAADGATIERRTRINRPDDESARCKVSRAPDRHKDFSQCLQQSTPPTSNAISHRQERTELSGPRRCRHGTKSSPQREPGVLADLPRGQFGNVREPSWWQAAALNTAHMGWFSSDRTISEYARETWNVPVKPPGRA